MLGAGAPKQPEMGRRVFPLSRELWIEREDFNENPPKGYFRLFPGNKVRLRYGYVIECTGVDKDADGNVIAVQLPAGNQERHAGADSVKVKGNIHWVSAPHACEAEVRLYDRLFNDPNPDAGGKNFLDALNPDRRRSSPPIWSRACATPSQRTVSSSSGTATSWRTASIRSRASRCSTARLDSRTAGASKHGANHYFSA
jgi:hypothetical protein